MTVSCQMHSPAIFIPVQRAHISSFEVSQRGVAWVHAEQRTYLDLLILSFGTSSGGLGDAMSALRRCPGISGSDNVQDTTLKRLVAVVRA